MLHDFVEEFALAYEELGIPRVAGRILGWLMVCDPPEQNATQLVEALGASKASVSTMTRLLVGMHLIEKVPRRGFRSDFYRIRPGSWTERAKSELAGLSYYQRLAAKGLRLLENTPVQRSERLKEMHDIYSFLVEEGRDMLQRLEGRLARPS